MPRLLISINAAWNVVNFRANLVRALVADGHEVIAAVVDDGALPGVAALGARPIPLAMSARGVSPLADLALSWRYWRLMRRERPDAFLGWTIKPNVYGSLAARLAGVPAINNISGLGTAFIRATWLTRVARALYRIGLGASSTVFFQNEDDRAVFVDGGLVRADQVVMLPGSGIDPAWASAQVRREDDGVFRYLLVARLIADKGVHEYVAAARALRADLPHVRCQILGFLDVDNRTAIARATLDAWVAEGVVEYLGAADDVRPHMARADCVVLPSYREGTSRVLLEASAMARPVIASDVPGCRNVVVDGATGYLCAPRDAASLANAMRRMATISADTRFQMGQNGRGFVTEHFSESTVIEAYRKAIGRALSATRSPVGGGG